MRRIAAVAAATGAIVSGLALAASPADAAGHTWSARHSFANESASGTYSRAANSVTVGGKLTDTKKDGWTACVRYKFTKPGYVDFYSLHYIVDNKGKRFDGKATIPLRPATLNVPGGPQHFYVQACRLNTKSGAAQYGSLKIIF